MSRLLGYPSPKEKTLLVRFHDELIDRVEEVTAAPIIH